MGFLNQLLNPVKHLRNSIDSTKHLLHGDFSGAVASSPLLNRGMSSPKAPATGAMGPGGIPGVPSVDPSQYQGDPNDPSYGSFTKPFDVEQFYNYADPGYAFQLQQGTQALQNAASAGSGAFSGAALKDLLKYNQDYAGTAYGAAFDRYNTTQNNIFGRLSDIAHLGENAAAGVGNQGTALAGSAGQFTSNAGSATGAGIVGAGNNLSNGLTNYWLMKNFNNQPVMGGAPGGV